MRRVIGRTVALLYAGRGSLDTGTVTDAVHTIVRGQGRPLVLLHGWGFELGIFDDLADALAAHWEVHAVDLPGHGRSAPVDAAARVEDLADAVAAATPAEAIWIGWSLGGLVALAAAQRGIAHAHALVLVCATPRMVASEDWPHAITRASLAQFGARLRSDHAATVAEFLALQDAAEGHAAARIAELSGRVRATDPSGLAAGERILATSDLRDSVSRVSTPALLVTGGRDALVPHAMAADWRRTWPALETRTIAHAAHAPFLSHPEEFRSILDDFLARHSMKGSAVPSASGRHAGPDTSAIDKGSTTMSSNSPGPSDNVRLPAETLQSLYATMQRVRRFDQRVAELFEAGEIKGTAHSYVGEEAVAAAVCAHLGEADYIASNHRGHGHCIAKGARMDLMMAELMGHEDGYCRGLGGSMHIADLDLNILGANGIVGASMPLSCGAALASQLRGGDQVVVAFFGDGASNQGVFHESLNLAAVWKLPMVFVCENNQYALTTSFRRTTAVDQVAERASAYGIPGITVDGNDVAEVYHVVGDAVARARAGEGPTLVEAMTYRWGQHSMRANLKDPRPEAEYEEWMGRDPIARVEATLRGSDGARVETIAADVERELEAAVEFARAGVEPTVATLEGAVYAPHLEPEPAPGPGSRDVDFVVALNEALDQEMARDERVLLMGEDVAGTGGIFQVSRGLVDKYGEGRVRDTPISEATFVGCGVGAAIAGLRPVVEIQIFDFIALTMDMLVNQAAKFRFMLGGKNTVPLVVRGPQGGGVRLAAQHSQSLEAWFTHVPGLVVVAPSTPYDAKGLLVSAIRDDNPVIFLETKLLYMTAKGPVPEALYALPIGKADVKRAGTDVTVVATMAMVPRALAAAEQLEREGVSVEVVDPRTLRPLDEETILASVRKTSRLVIVHEAWSTGGFGAEVAAVVASKALLDLDAPIERVGALDVPMPYNDALERATIPSQERIVEAIRTVAEF